MGWRLGSALLLAALLAGCADNQQLSGRNAFALATPEPASPATVPADPSFRLSELKPGLSKAELETLYPNRLVLGSSFGRNQYYFVEPPGVTTGTKVARDRLELFVNDGKLAAFGVTRSDDEVMGATEIGRLPFIPSGPTTTR